MSYPPVADLVQHRLKKHRGLVLILNCNISHEKRQFSELAFMRKEN
jgi:hypothetical protein